MSGTRRLFLATLIAVALLTKTDPDSAHVMSRLGTVESIADRHTYALDDSIFIGTIDKVLKDDHFYSHQPPLLSTIEAPVYWVLHLPGTGFNNRGRFVMTYAFSLLTNGLALTLTVLVFAGLFGRVNIPSPSRELLALVIVCGTWLLPYGLVPNNHGISGLLMAFSISTLLDYEQRGPTRARMAAMGAALGLLAAIELLPIVSFVPLVVIFLLMRRDLDARAWVSFGAALAIPLLAHAVINMSITGDVIPAGFHTELFTYPGSRFDASTLTGTLKHHTVGDAWSYAWRALFAGKGFFVFSPICLLGVVVGMIEWRWWRGRAKGVHAVMFTGTLVSLAVALLMTNNDGGEAVGFRHAVYLVPAMTIFLLPWLIESTRRTVVIAVAAASTLSMLLFAIRQPWYVLTLASAKIGAWSEYAPIVARIARRTLFNP